MGKVLLLLCSGQDKNRPFEKLYICINNSQIFRVGFSIKFQSIPLFFSTKKITQPLKVFLFVVSYLACTQDIFNFFEAKCGYLLRLVQVVRGVGERQWFVDPQLLPQQQEVPRALSVGQPLELLELPLVVEQQTIALQRKKN